MHLTEMNHSRRSAAAFIPTALARFASALPALATAFLLAAPGHASAQPTFLWEPLSQSVSAGVNVYFTATAYGDLPVSYQWQKGGVDLPDEMMDILFFAPAQPGDSGDYTVVASDASGSITSRVATLTVDSSFAKITTGPLVADPDFSYGASWADYDNDGDLDMFVTKGGSRPNALYRNDGGGVFTPITTGSIVTDLGTSVSASWGDYDNNGHLDLFVANQGQGCFLYRNNGNGAFTRVTTGPVVTNVADSISGTWGDYDGDGFIDLYVTNPGFGVLNFLYHNNGNGTFTRLTNGAVGGDAEFKNTIAAAWGDYDNDGDPDLYVANSGFNGSFFANELLYRNDGNGAFTKILTDPAVTAGGGSFSCAFVDYDNDLDLDLYVSNANAGSTVNPNEFLFQNNGNGTFTRVTNSIIAADGGNSQGVAWGDYDNDGWIDLFVANFGQNNSLYRNNGDGTFTKTSAGSLGNDGGSSISCIWGDYDNDGFLDLFVTNLGENNFLYRNNGNSNAWLHVKCVGGPSNRAAIGAKVKVLAAIGGTNRWQMREIASREGFGSPGTLYGEFGLGDATNASLLRIEWPSRLITEMDNVPARQLLTVTERTYSILPKNPGAAIGSDFTFTLGGVAGETLLFQWRFNGTNLPAETNASLLLTNVQTASVGTYTVAITDPASGHRFITAPNTLRAAVRPAIAVQPVPVSQSVSLGVNINYQPVVTGTEPLAYQWRLNGADVPGATNVTLALTNIQANQSGAYVLVATNLGGAATSQVVTLIVDSSFTKIIAGNLVSDGGASFGAAWLDLCGNGLPGLFVANDFNENNFLYQNNGDRTFTRLQAPNPGTIVSDGGASIGVAVGDYDNDGRADVFVANFNQSNFLYRGLCDGDFTKITSGSIVTDRVRSWGCAWADYDNDGWLDLYVGVNGADLLYHNNQDGTFTRITNSLLAADAVNSRGCAWADYDNDGDADLYVANTGNDFLYRNNGDGTFTKITTGNIVTDGGTSNGAAWGDYDNDGDLDLFVANNGNEFLYRNEGGGAFTKITNSIVVTVGGNSWTGAWADYDCDGWLDLFVANNGIDFLFRNNGDGTFARVLTGSVVNDGGDSRGCAWGDFDNDGYPDLYVSNYGTNNFLYRATPGTNRWLKVKCVGTASNRSGIGAKVRVLATIGGVARWQMREITSGDGLANQQLIAMFGLGDATVINTIRVEWPSGRVQEAHNIPAGRSLTVTEDFDLGALRMVNGAFQMRVNGGTGIPYAIETSSNLTDWLPWMTVTNTIPPTPVIDWSATNAPQRFYRAKKVE